MNVLIISYLWVASVVFVALVALYLMAHDPETGGVKWWMLPFLGIMWPYTLYLFASAVLSMTEDDRG